MGIVTMAVYSSSRALRGGSWINNARNTRSANRNANERDNRNNNIGFRLALSSMNRGGWMPGAASMDQMPHPERPDELIRWSPNRKAPGALVGACAERRRRTPSGPPPFIWEHWIGQKPSRCPRPISVSKRVGACLLANVFGGNPEKSVRLQAGSHGRNFAFPSSSRRALVCSGGAA